MVHAASLAPITPALRLPVSGSAGKAARLRHRSPHRCDQAAG
jgi:hypothetical protein